LKLRLSTTGEDISVDCHSKETVHVVKQRLHQTMIDTIPVANQQRWFYGGRILLDKMRIGDCRIPQNFVIQVVVNNNNSNSNGKSLNLNSNQETTKLDHQQSIADQSTIDTNVVILSKETERNHTDEKTAPPPQQPLQIRPSSITSSSAKDPNPSSPSLPGSALLPSSAGNEHTKSRTGSSSSRKSQGKHQNRKLKTHHSSTSSATNGTSSVPGTTTVVLQQRCNSFNSKRSNESPTPVET